MSKQRWALCGVLILMAAACMLAVFRLGAATPPTGTIAPESQPVSWTGTGAGGTSNGEGTCVEGVNCDTFTLTVNGAPLDWLGRRIEVSITWVVLASDYDLYIHKGSNSGPIVDSSAGSSPGTNEVAHIEPTDLDEDGSTTFTVHVVYFSAAAGDQYRGVARAITGGGPLIPPLPLSKNWTINYHGECCEGNLAASGNNTYVLLPVLVDGNIIKKSTDGGKTWKQTYPPAPVSYPFGIEGDMQAFGGDAIFFGTELAHAIVAHSDDQGETWLTFEDPIASAGNDQAWAYLGPFANMRPGGALPLDEPYVLAGWMRIGTALAFSFDGGRTFSYQTVLVGNDGSGPEHIVCQQNATNPPNPGPGDTRVPNAAFVNWKANRHGTWGTDKKFYWTETVRTSTSNTLYVCQTADFGTTWTGTKHPVAPGPGSDFVVSHSAFDNNGTLYVLHGDKLYVSFNQGKTFAFTHTLPHYGSSRKSDDGSDQYFVVNCGTAHVAVQEDAGNGNSRVYYLRGTGVDTATPTWDEELVDAIGDVRLDFLYIVLNGNSIPTISYTTPGSGSQQPLRQVTTASRNAPMPALGSNTCGLVSVSAVSRKTHGPAGPFDVPLPLDGPPGIECRAGGGANLDTHQVIVRFGSAPSIGNIVLAPAVNKTAEFDGVPTLDPATNQLTINLKNVSDAQTLNIVLQTVVVAGAPAADVTIPMMVLAGDTNADTRVNVGDTNQAKGASGTTTVKNSARVDVNTDGRINVGDVNFVKAHAGSPSPTPAARERSR